MAEPTLRDVHVDGALTDFSVAYWQEPGGYIAQNVFPITTVNTKSDKYHIYDKDAGLRSDAEKRSPNTPAARRSYTLSQDNYNCDVYSVAIGVSEQIAANADAALDPEEDAARQTVQDLKIRMDMDWATAAFSTGIWATESTATWSGSTGDPIGDIATAVSTILSNTGKRANTLVLGADSWYSGLWQNAAVVARLPNDSAKIVTTQFIATMFDFDRVYIAQSVRNTVGEGLTGSYSFNMADHALVAYVDQAPGLRSPTAGRTFMWTGLVGSQDGLRTLRFDDQINDNVPLVQTDAAYDFKVTGTDLGYLIKDTVS